MSKNLKMSKTSRKFGSMEDVLNACSALNVLNRGEILKASKKPFTRSVDENAGNIERFLPWPKYEN